MNILAAQRYAKGLNCPGATIHPAWRVSYGDNEVFVKCDAREQLPIFTAEADQLALLARSKSVRVPEVYGVGSDRDYSFLLLEYQQLKPSTPGRLLSGPAAGAPAPVERATAVRPRLRQRSDHHPQPNACSAAGRNSSPNSASAGSCAGGRRAHDLW